MSAFNFIDSVSEVKKNESLTAFFRLKGSEEFLKDHFAGFPVMPGVMLLESLKQAAARLLMESGHGNEAFFRLTEARDLKFGQFVKPGNTVRLFVRLVGVPQNGNGASATFEGRMDLMRDEVPAGKALSAGFSLARV